jgi:small subunit ribosomal protein S2
MATTQVDIKKLLEAGAHFGHQSSRWHPRMAPYIHSKREGNHIIDLTKTVEALDKALAFLTDTAGAGKQILLVSTKRQAKDKVKEVAMATNMPYVTERWLGGMLTNVATIGGRIKHLKDLESRMISGELANRYSKLEVQRIQEEIDDMNHMYGGIKDMAAKPGAVFVVDVINDGIAVKEARKLGVPVVAIVDTNGDPSQVTYPIPANDDATKAVTLILDYVQAAIEAGQKKAAKPADKTEAAEKPAAKPAEAEAKPEKAGDKAEPKAEKEGE